MHQTYTVQSKGSDGYNYKVKYGSNFCHISFIHIVIPELFRNTPGN